ncbi:phage recombination protein Bet [Nonomuraea basaltis]|uniref:phage recombination protein Bet n=1 Tax=Nonomuraea basaltis TaxID=2495887 RepID=UPI00110C4654|nr:phage recombination protein Bet [Nonomuraea basaltis]TMR90530.1 phage recombination protein Bet [Nonomuraea basaltis]
MSTDTLPAVHSSGALAIQPDQDNWTPEQRAVLTQLGVQGDCPTAVLVGYLHLCQRRGLDPFLKQVYLVGRNQKQRDGSYRTVYTPQTGIDGFRVLAQRAARRTGIEYEYEYEDTIWFAPDGSRHEVWLWDKPPAAAKVTVLKNGKRFSGVALYSAYVDTDREGKPKNRWKADPAGMTAKCAEAQALRKAFPEDLGDLYTDDEMAHLHDDEVNESAARTLRQATANGSQHADEDPKLATAVVMASNQELHSLAKLMDAKGVTDKLAYLHKVFPEEVFSSAADLTAEQAQQVTEALNRGDHLDPEQQEPDEPQEDAAQPSAAEPAAEPASEAEPAPAPPAPEQPQKRPVGAANRTTLTKLNTLFGEAGVSDDARFMWLAQNCNVEVTSTVQLIAAKADEAIRKLEPEVQARCDDLKMRIVTVWTDLGGTRDELTPAVCWWVNANTRRRNKPPVTQIGQVSNVHLDAFLKALSAGPGNGQVTPEHFRQATAP